MRTAAVVLSSFLALAAPAPARAEDDLDRAAALVAEGRARGLDFQQWQDKQVKGQAKDALQEARKTLDKRLDKDAGCERCRELLLEALFYETYFGFRKDYDAAVKLADESRERSPNHTGIAFQSGYVYFNAGKMAEASKALNDYLLLGEGEPEKVAHARQILEQARQGFLGGWNEHADFYDSNLSRLLVLNPQTNQWQVAVQITKDWEMQLGAQALTQFTSEGPKLEDPEIQSYLERLVARLVEATPGPFERYQVHVIDSPAVNAVTLPGQIAVFTGLLGFAETESHLVGVLAHEIGHNFGHHAARRYIQALNGQNIAASIQRMADPQNAMQQTIAQLATTIGLDLFLKAYSRSEEKEADHYGAHIAFNAGWDPTALPEFFHRMYEANPDQPLKWLSTHPPAPKRVEYLTGYLEAFPLERELKRDSEEFQRIRARFAPAPSDPGGRGVLPPR